MLATSNKMTSLVCTKLIKENNNMSIIRNGELTAEHGPQIFQNGGCNNVSCKLQLTFGTVTEGVVISNRLNTVARSQKT